MSRNAQEQLIRMQFVEAMLVLRGSVSRIDVAQMFEIAPACVTRDIARYRIKNPRFYYNSATRRYEVEKDFQPVPKFLHVSHDLFVDALEVVTGYKADRP
ncbi:TPA: hypothetical protein ACGQ50_000772 [Enterobacter cloacae]